MPRAVAPPGTTAILLATAAGEEGGPAAALAWEDGTLLSRIAGQLAWMEIGAIHVLTRPRYAGAVRAAAGAGAQVHECDAVADDLRAVAGIARASAGPVVVALAEVVTQHHALAGLVVDPRAPTGILAMREGRGHPLTGRPFSFRTRSVRQRVESSSSPYHSVRWPTHRFLGVLKVAPADLEALAAVAERLAELTASPPPDWEGELEAKARRWRRQLGAALRAGEADDEEGEDRPEAESEEAGEDVEEAGEREAQAVLPEEFEREIAHRHAAAGEDVSALLLVGLLRSHVAVRDVYTRWFYWARPLSADGVAWAREKLAGRNEDRALLATAVKRNDGFFTTFFVSPYSRYIARWAARRGLTPNQVTTVSLLIGFAAAAAFATGERAGLIAGAVLLQVAFTTDCVDGQLARYTRRFSKLGAWLDSVFDRTKEYAVFGGLAIGASQAGDPLWVLAAAALTLQTVRHGIDSSYAIRREEKAESRRQQPLEVVSDKIGPWKRRRPLPEGAEPAPASPPLGKRVLLFVKGLDEHPVTYWLKRILAFPIGERFAVISLTAALFGPRTTFTAMLAWGGVAASYSTAGRLLRSR